MKNIYKLITGIVLITASINAFSAQTTKEVVALVKQTKAAIEKNALQTLARVNRAEPPYKNKNNPSLYIFVFNTALSVIIVNGS